MNHPWNTEAGAVPFPDDAVEVDLALTSARVVWRAFPYAAARYGQRGERFGASDAGWLVCLPRLPLDAHREQVLWLAAVLSPRGLPSWMLEVQLEHLARRGGRAGWAGAVNTDIAAKELRERRRAAFDDATFDEAGRRCARALGAEHSARARGLGKLTASALADVEAGFSSSADAFLSWVRGLDGGQGPVSAGVDEVLALTRHGAGG